VEGKAKATVLQLDMEDKYPVLNLVLVSVKYALTSRKVCQFVQAVCMYSDQDTVTSLNV
jgi:hypothetical protein